MEHYYMGVMTNFSSTFQMFYISDYECVYISKRAVIYMYLYNKM